MSATIDRLTITTRDVLEMNAHDGAAARAVIAALEAAAPVHITYRDRQDRVVYIRSVLPPDLTRRSLILYRDGERTEVAWHEILAVELNLGMTGADREERDR